MIATETGLTWRRVGMGDAGRGGRFHEYRCVEHPRLTRLVQRPNDAEPYAESFHVDGITQYYHTEGAALTAMRANPGQPHEPR